MSQRFACTVGIHPERVAEYKKLHADIWPEIVAMIKQCNIANTALT